MKQSEIEIISEELREASHVRRRFWIKVAVIFGFLACVLAYPVLYMGRGIHFKSHMRENGIKVSMSMQIDGFGFGLSSYPPSDDINVEFNETLYDDIGNNPHQYLLSEYNVREGLAGFFFSVGVNLLD